VDAVDGDVNAVVHVTEPPSAVEGDSVNPEGTVSVGMPSVEESAVKDSGHKGKSPLPFELPEPNFVFHERLFVAISEGIEKRYDDGHEEGLATRRMRQHWRRALRERFKKNWHRQSANIKKKRAERGAALARQKQQRLAKNLDARKGKYEKGVGYGDTGVPKNAPIVKRCGSCFMPNARHTKRNCPYVQYVKKSKKTTRPTI
jgi:hypothetical protein